MLEEPRKGVVPSGRCAFSRYIHLQDGLLEALPRGSGVPGPGLLAAPPCPGRLHSGA